MKLILITILASIACSQAFLFGSDVTWDDLKVTWGPNPLSSYYFNSMPRTVEDAVYYGWVLEKDCSKYNGNRYILNGDRSVILIFNTAGRIAGIATAFSKGQRFDYPSEKQAKYLQDEGTEYTINAYFQDPSTVCTMTKESVSPKATFATGDRLIIVGDKITYTVPINENELTEAYSKGGCFPTMGRHYYGHVDAIPFTSSIQPSELNPIFLLYNKGKLNAFGWIFNAYLEGDRYEHAPTSSASIFLPAMPEFLSDPTANDLISSIHIFLDSTPLLNYC